MAKKVEKKKKVTPLMQQYFDIKSKYPDAILLFRVGDFYETFGEDAIVASKILGIVLTSRNNGGSKVELAGFPFHSVDVYLPRLVRAGFRVAVCEQLEKPSKEKKIVKRGVTEMITPGLATNDQLLDHKTNNFLCSIISNGKDFWGLSFLDLSTGEFLVTEGNTAEAQKTIQSLAPSEFIYCRTEKALFEKCFGTDHYSFMLDDWAFSFDNNEKKLLDHFKVKTLKGFGIQDIKLGIIAAGASLIYLDTTENRNVRHITSIKRINQDSYVWLDEFTVSNLELIRAQHPSGVPLVQILDSTKTAMGARLLKKWIVMPLLSVPAINRRLNIVDYYISNVETFQEVLAKLSSLNDLERVISKVSLLKINPREMYQLMLSLRIVREIKELLIDASSEEVRGLADKINPCNALIDRISHIINEDPPVNINKGGAIREAVDEELDEIRSLISNSKTILLNLQKKEIEATGILNLKVGFNNVFGYFFEVTNKYKGMNLIPDHWVRKQTLTNCERYISDELKVLEEKILTAQDRISSIEYRIFEDLIQETLEYIKPIQINSNLVAQLDCLSSFAGTALQRNYTRPNINDSRDINLKASRHPVIEALMKPEEQFVANDVSLSPDDNQIIMITGPNMAGKSAVLRQVALISIMGQIGCYVPANEANLGIVDKIFTRVGASDNISHGESTFMVEMNETASILNNLSDRSLILLDEIGRGTSTYDGISIAWAIAEFLHEQPKVKPKTLFATHYHELSELSKKFERIVNYTIDTRVQGKELIFLRKLIPGASMHSFGILVARMAGMPFDVVERSEEILALLQEKKSNELGDGVKDLSAKVQKIQKPIQLSLFESVDKELIELKNEIIELDLNKMTPVECLMQIINWQKKMLDSE